jgi:hypothetical protein
MMGRVSPGIDLHIEFLRELYGETYRQVVPAIAAEMLADGVSTPALDELAGLTNGTRDSIIAPLLLRAGDELHWERLSGERNRFKIGQLYAEAIAIGSLAAAEGAWLVWKTVYWNVADTDQDRFQGFADMGSDIEDYPDQLGELEEAIRKLAIDMLEERRGS